MSNNVDVFRSTAHLYDLIYQSLGKDYATESAEIDRLIQRRVDGARTLLDVACGTGGHLRHLTERYEVVGVDIDPIMLAEARHYLPVEVLHEGDMRIFDLGQTFDAVTCLFSSIGYMRDVEGFRRATTRMAAHLRPGGLLVIDGWVRPDEWRGEISVNVETASADELKVARLTRSRRRGNQTVLEMHHLVGTDRGIEHLVDQHELTLFEPSEYESALEQAAFGDVEVTESPMPGRDRYSAIKT